MTTTDRNRATLADLLNRPTESAPKEEPKPTPRKSTGPSIGFLNPAAIEQALLVLLYVATVTLAVLSVLGTFYGLRGEVAPLDVVQVVRDVWSQGPRFGGALFIQTVLTIAQYGSRQWARRDPRWWFGYLAALGVSVYYNIQAYADPLMSMQVPWLIAWCIIIAGDVLPEFVAVRRP
jgi:hypothetical protein